MLQKLALATDGHSPAMCALWVLGSQPSFEGKKWLEAALNKRKQLLIDERLSGSPASTAVRQLGPTLQRLHQQLINVGIAL